MGDLITTDILSTGNQRVDNLTWQPIFFNLHSNVEEKRLEEFILNHPTLVIVDEIASQLNELVKLRFPKKQFTPGELAQAVEEYLEGAELKRYGNWVYYPWLNKLVHVLPEDEFVEVRTNRNQYKITPEEENILAQKKIGVIGLSVGKAIALTIALERICGHLVLADFDEIELSNLNRIQTGIHNFGVKKTVVVAREIAEIDPYLKVTCYDDGLTESNVDDFFTRDGQLDICIEVCDGLYEKIYAREKAKELGVAVVMNSSDRGTTDIERFDLNPDLPLLHGLIDHLDLSKVKQAKTNEEKVPYLLPMLGVETSSERLKASMLEIQESITTWPQLASGVVFGGGICTDVCRRILLGQFTKSGRYFVDTEQEINDEVEDYISFSKNQTKTIQVIPPSDVSIYDKVISDYLESTKLNEDSIQLEKSELDLILEAACKAPSGGNIQPWKWIYKGKVLFLFIDQNRTNSILNFDNTAARIALGAASYNLELKAHEKELNISCTIQPENEVQDLVAVFQFSRNKGEYTNRLVHSISSRLTNRMIKATGTLSENELEFYKSFEVKSDVLSFQLLTNREQIDAMKRCMMQVDKLYYTSKVGHDSFTNELRWSQEEASVTRDGVDLDTIDLTPTERAGFEVSKKWEVVKHLNDWDLGAAYSKLTQKGVDSASALGIIIGPDEPEKKNYFLVGQLLQELWLESTHRGIAFQPMSISTFLTTRAKFDKGKTLGELTQEFRTIGSNLKSTLELDESERPVFIFRLTKADTHEVRALRRPIEDVFSYER